MWTDRMTEKPIIGLATHTYLPYLDYLFLGPSGLTLGKSEVLHLPSFTKANCSTPTFPPEGYTYYSYVGTLTPEGPLLCGGDHNGETQSFCHLLTRSGNWEEVQGMNMRRSGAAALEIDGGWWVTGKLYHYDLLVQNLW